MADIYSISGFFNAESLQNIPFAGFCLVQDIDVSGYLVDCFGHSGIEGLIEGNFLTFNKYYSEDGSPINFSFEKRGDIWAGKYEPSDNDDSMNLSYCKLSLHWPNINPEELESCHEIAKGKASKNISGFLIINERGLIPLSLS